LERLTPWKVREQNQEGKISKGEGGEKRTMRLIATKRKRKKKKGAEK